MPTTQHNTGRRPGEQIASEARDLIEDRIGKENVDVLFGFLQSIGDVVLRGVRQTGSYARRHPVRIAVGVVAIGFLTSMLAKSRMKETLH